MNYEALSTFSLLRLLNAAPGDSAEHRAIQAELRRREVDDATRANPVTLTRKIKKISGRDLARQRPEKVTNSAGQLNKV
jgi:hypothetical protein